MWTRPVLCRLCECPAPDGGVRVDQLDAEKLSGWWRRTIGAEFEPGQGEIICQFCVCDARLEYKYAVDESTSDLEEECDWWSGLDECKFFAEFYYKDETIQRCRVDLGPEECKIPNEHSSSSTLHHIIRTESATNNLHKCLICTKVLSTQYSFMSHMKNIHAGQFVQCRIKERCARVFLTEQEKMEHIQKDHASIKKCEFCNGINDRFNCHMKKHHENLIRCIYRNCRSYYHSEEELQKTHGFNSCCLSECEKMHLLRLILPPHATPCQKSSQITAGQCFQVPALPLPKIFLG